MTDASKTHGELLFDAITSDEVHLADTNRSGMGPYTTAKDGGTVLDGLYDLERAAHNFLTSAGMLGKWRPMSEHKFPWPHSKMAVAAHKKDDPTNIETFVCTCADRGNLYPDDYTTVFPLALDEIGYVPFSWLDMTDLHYTVDEAVERAVKDREEEIALDEASAARD